MPNKVYANVVGNRVLIDGAVVEDVTSVSLPAVEYPTQTINSSGMAMDVNIPNQAHVNAMELSISHNNGVNCKLLAGAGKHNVEFRIARQRYNVADAEAEYESDKFRFVVMHTSTDQGNVENGNPLGNTEKYSVFRFEKEMDGEVVTLVDATSGIIRVNGESATDKIESLLN